MPQETTQGTGELAYGPSKFKCEKCEIDFPSKLALGGHIMGKHKPHRCSICKAVFETKGKLGLHKIEAHGFTRESVGWGLGLE